MQVLGIHVYMIVENRINWIQKMGILLVLYLCRLRVLLIHDGLVQRGAGFGRIHLLCRELCVENGVWYWLWL